MRRFLSSTWGILIAVFFVIFALIVADRFQALGPFHNAITGALSPFQSGYSRLIQGAQNFAEYFSSRKELSQQNQELSRRVETLLAENSDLRRQISESAVLSAQQDFLAEKTFAAVDAHVIGRSLLPSPNVLVVNRGSSDGVQAGSAVLSAQGVFVGKVVELTSSTSKILTVTDPNSSVAVLVQNSAGSLGIARGSHNLVLELSRIPQDDTITAGEAVLTAGTESGVPRGLVVGTVEEVRKTEGELFQNASVIPAVDLGSLTIVSIIVP